MEKLFEYMAKEWSVVSQAPFAFLIISAIIFGLVYLVSKWHFTGTLNETKAANETLRERLLLKSEQAESYKERALKYDDKVQKVIESDSISLRERALELVKSIREFSERHKREDQHNSQAQQAAMRKAKTEEEKNATWDYFTNEMMRLGSERNAEYERRFRIDAILLRDEYRSRMPDYEPLDQHIDMLYEHPTNYFGYSAVADDLERMAKTLKQ
ncbi:hypothetical protein EKK97_13805 [Billgrantia tianxiuensis]|uniref:Uncharacterized protein n=1 Tax=Billgrantia tianxiuensis TaxID=2497861 RepID=A0A6I6SRR2_9GAMM|nr:MULTISPECIES: hypothetical protein [Halomonas]MCE8034572.1 hypothetical protein [Halomonas sp. MCCC 1A11057]QHC50440.1 hypothetical protein EKK97_13805 [Halomonas tianxiuensis]